MTNDNTTTTQADDKVRLARMITVLVLYGIGAITITEIACWYVQNNTLTATGDILAILTAGVLILAWALASINIIMFVDRRRGKSEG